MELSHATPARASWQCFTRDERLKLEALVDSYRRRHGPLVAWRLPTGEWAQAFGKHPSSIRRELARGKMRMGSEDTVVHYAYSAHLALKTSVSDKLLKGRSKSLNERSGFIMGIGYQDGLGEDLAAGVDDTAFCSLSADIDS